MADTSLSTEEFQRIQTSLLELRTSNYQLVEQGSRKDREINNLESKVRKLEEDLQKALKNADRNKRAKGSDIFDGESDTLRRKLAIQEEEFRLQQATLMEELQRVILQQEELEKQVRELQETNNDDRVIKLEEENARLKKAFEEMKSEEKREIFDGEKSETAELNAAISKMESEKRNVESKFVAAESKIATLEQEKRILSERLSKQMEEAEKKLANLTHEISDLKEQLRKKQASYVSLTEEKERNLEEYKKSLDHMTQKKDAEIRTVIEEANAIKKQMHALKESEHMWTTQKESLETALNKARGDLHDIREQNEAFQIRLQETISASDCLSNNLQETRSEVEKMQKKLDDANELAAKRKDLLDEMSHHMEKMKNDFLSRERELNEKYAAEIDNLKSQLKMCQQQNDELQNLRQKFLLVETFLQDSERRNEEFAKKVDELNSQFENEQGAYRQLIAAKELEFQQEIESLRKENEADAKEHENVLATAATEHKNLWKVIESLKQEVKDKEDAVNVVDRKHHSLMKDLKRQLQNEKKRNDRLQEKIQEIETRNKSPGNTSFEEIRNVEIVENRPKAGGDATSVSSWSMVSGHAHKENDRHSNHPADMDSESSMTMLESDNQELIVRVADLQKKNCELQERINLLEDSSSAMAQDLVNKSAIIEQFLKEKSAAHVSGIGSPEKIAPSLKKMMEIIKIDQSAAEIRDMNKRLQLMLEETLTKNMHLQKDLETMSQEVARLSRTVLQR